MSQSWSARITGSHGGQAPASLAGEAALRCVIGSHQIRLLIRCRNGHHSPLAEEASSSHGATDLGGRPTRTRHLVDQSAKPALPESGATLLEAANGLGQSPARLRDYPSCHSSPYSGRNCTSTKADLPRSIRKHSHERAAGPGSTSDPEAARVIRDLLAPEIFAPAASLLAAQDCRGAHLVHACLLTPVPGLLARQVVLPGNRGRCGETDPCARAQ